MNERKRLENSIYTIKKRLNKLERSNKDVASNMEVIHEISIKAVKDELARLGKLMYEQDRKIL